MRTVLTAVVIDVSVSARCIQKQDSQYGLQCDTLLISQVLLHHEKCIVVTRVCWRDCKREGPLFSAEFVCESVCLCVSDGHFYPSTLADFHETWSQGPYSDLVWPRP